MVRPREFDIGENSIVAYIFTGTTLSPKIDINSASLREVTQYNWIHVNYDLNKVAIFATGSAAVGEYKVVIAQSFKDYPDVYPFTHFKVAIHPEQKDAPVKK